jgi:hypothetical protein
VGSDHRIHRPGADEQNQSCTKAALSEIREKLTIWYVQAMLKFTLDHEDEAFNDLLHSIVWKILHVIHFNSLDSFYQIDKTELYLNQKYYYQFKILKFKVPFIHQQKSSVSASFNTQKSWADDYRKLFFHDFKF